MNEFLGSAYATLLSDLESHLAQDFKWPSPDAGFAVYIFDGASEAGPLPKPSALSWPASQRLVHAPLLAAAGYWIACGEGAAIQREWLDGIDRLSRCDPFPSDRQSFVYRPIELLGIATGAAACCSERPELARWLENVLDRSAREVTPDGWSTALRVASDAVLRGRQVSSLATSTHDGLAEVALRRWVLARFGDSPPDTDADSAVLTRALLEVVKDVDLAHAAVIFHTLRSVVEETIQSEIEKHWQVGRERRDAEAVVVNLCRRFHLFAQRITNRYNCRNTIEIKDEYDVQDLMHAMLNLHFNDVRAEEVTPSVAGKSSRMDFLLKREQLVVETKMTRKNLGQKEVGDELIIDIRRYRDHPDYRTLVCFVYDPGRYCPNPTALESDLSECSGEFLVRVIVCPTGM